MGQPLKTNLHQELFISKPARWLPHCTVTVLQQTPSVEPEKPTTLGWRLLMAKTQAKGQNSLHPHLMHSPGPVDKQATKRHPEVRL